ncbi:hypothetical protein BURCENBC7_AP1872 [Burkholderia cenocepacia BC7]|nr:hypothetical protein BURCENK562V_C4352 [Burkholderia cenocepacia K56-2Valvano]ERI32330.1 hypothetical protein BURCENBC7_AP1872 [Burkholderia cenocepacia BC7]
MFMLAERGNRSGHPMQGFRTARHVAPDQLAVVSRRDAVKLPK